MRRHRPAARLCIALVLAFGIGAGAPPAAEAGRIWNTVVKIATGKTPAHRRQIKRIRQNQRRGAIRARQVSRRYAATPFKRHWAEVDLVDARGRPLLDPVTGEGRRVDFVTKSPLGGYRLIEVTGRKTSKKAQEAKTRRIVDGRREIHVKLDGAIISLGRRPTVERVDRR